MDSVKDKIHMDEELDERCRFLRIRRRWWIIPLAAAAGALLCFLVYFIATTVFAPARRYEAVSKIYLTFAKDENGNAQDYYNGATWTDLLTADPAISDKIMAEMPEGTDLDTIRGEVTAQILSDIRLMTVTVSDPDPDRAEAILTAVDDALVAFGGESDVFESIEFLSRTPSKLVIYNDRTRNAVWLGLFLGALTGLFIVLIGATLDDAVYVPEEAERRYGLPAAGVLTKDGSFYGETKTDYDYITGGKELPRIGAGETEAGPAYFDALRESDGVLAEVPCGVKNGTATEHLLSELSKQNVCVKGLLLTGADAKFLDRYYRRDRQTGRGTKEIGRYLPGKQDALMEKSKGPSEDGSDAPGGKKDKSEGPEA